MVEFGEKGIASWLYSKESSNGSKDIVTYETICRAASVLEDAIDYRASYETSWSSKLVGSADIPYDYTYKYRASLLPAFGLMLQDMMTFIGGSMFYDEKFRNEFFYEGILCLRIAKVYPKTAEPYMSTVKKFVEKYSSEAEAAYGSNQEWKKDFAAWKGKLAKAEFRNDSDTVLNSFAIPLILPHPKTLDKLKQFMKGPGKTPINIQNKKIMIQS